MRKRLLASFLCLCLLVGLLPTTALAEEPVELDISNGSIIITETGYSQGTLVYDKSTGYSVTGSGGDAVTETAWDTSPALTITGTSETNTILIMGGKPTITLSGISIEQTNGSTPGLVLMSGTDDGENKNTATIVLKGVNTLKGGKDAPGVQINANAALTIQGSGTLNATGSGQASGIGASNNNAFAVDPSTKLKGNGLLSGGELIIAGGTVTATKGNNNDKVYGIGGFQNLLSSVTVSGGDVTASGWSKIINVSKKIEISGGEIRLETGKGSGGIGLDASSIEISGGTLTRAKTNITAFRITPTITGGNIGDSYTGEIDGRTLTRLYFCTADGTPTADAEVTVTEDEHTWSARTDANGRITTYLAQGTTEITAKVGDGKTKTVAITNGRGVVGASCTCADHPGTLTMNTKPQSLTAINGAATLGLDASYTNTKDTCVLPEGFHGDYEKISYEITKVVKNGQYMVVDQYAKIEGNTLTVYGETNQDPYTVYVQAKSGPNGEVKSPEIAIPVNTYVSEADEGELDIADGSIIITETGYSQGTLVYDKSTGYSVTGSGGDAVTETKWSDESHALTITGTSETNTILIMGGKPTITLSGISIEQTNGGTPGLVLMSGSTDNPNTATLVLEGRNSLSGGDQAPGVQINGNATVTIQGDGELSTIGFNYAPGIGPGRAATYANNNNKNLGGGKLIINGGTVSSKENRGSKNTAGLGRSLAGKLASIQINGGVVTGNGSENAITASQKVEITGGIVELMTRSKGAGTGIMSPEISISGGTIKDSIWSSNGALFGDYTTLSITGGNIGDSYTGEIDGRTLTRLYFVETDGTPKGNMEVTVAEGENEWNALTDENGVITTYLASDTKNITVSYESQSNVSVTIPESHQALIGGSCSCSTVSGITWETGLPESITLHNLNAEGKPVSMNYDVPAAQLVTNSPCNMPIHPELPAITYSLSVAKAGVPVEGDVSQYATFSDYHLTLLPGNAPYTVTLTATADGKTVSAGIEVKKGDAGSGGAEISTINLALGNATISYNEDGTYSYTQGGNEPTSVTSGTFLITGFAPNGSVTVMGGSPTLIINQNDPGDVWTLYDGGAKKITLQPRSFNNKLRFGAAGSTMPELSYISAAPKLKLNPDQGDITFNADGSVTQGKFTITALKDNEEIAIWGADAEAVRTVTNNTTAGLTVKINGEDVALAEGENHTIPTPKYTNQDKTSPTTKTYIFDNGDGTYALIAVGEGDASAPPLAMIDERYKINEALLDDDFSGTLYVSSFLVYAGLKELHAEQFSNVEVYTSTLGHIYLGAGLTDLRWGNYCATTGFTVDPKNPNFTADEKGVLYSKDYTTLYVIPSGLQGDYTTNEACTTVNASATMLLQLTSLTLGKNVSSITGGGGKYVFFANNLKAINVEAGNPYFASKDGILYRKPWRSERYARRHGVNASLTAVAY